MSHRAAKKIRQLLCKDIRRLSVKKLKQAFRKIARQRDIILITAILEAICIISLIIYLAWRS